MSILPYALCVLGLMTTIIHAKPVDIQKLSEAKGWSSSVEASYKSEKGFDDKVTTSGELTTQYIKGMNLGIGIVEGHQDAKNGAPDGNSNLIHLRYRRFYSPKIGYESYVQRESDTDKALTEAYLSGSGPFYRFYHSYFVDLTTGTALVSEIERYQDRKTMHTNRIYTYLSGGIRVPKSLFVGGTIQVEPKVTDATNYRAYSKLFLKYKVESNTTVGFLFDRVYDTYPTIGVPHSNQVTTTTIGVEF